MALVIKNVTFGPREVKVVEVVTDAKYIVFEGLQEIDVKNLTEIEAATVPDATTFEEKIIKHVLSSNGRTGDSLYGKQIKTTAELVAMYEKQALRGDIVQAVAKNTGDIAALDGRVTALEAEPIVP